MLAFATYGYGIAMVFLTGFLLGRAMRLAMRLIALAVCLVAPPLLAWTCAPHVLDHGLRSEEHTSELQSLMRISYAVFCLKKKKSNRLHLTEYTDIRITKSR